MKDHLLTILQGDALTVLKTLPDESVQCVVTSPPYWGLRDYGVNGQLGLEKTPTEYLEKMTAVFSEVRRVLKSDGTAWVNMGDGYSVGTNTDRKPSKTGKNVPAGWSNRSQLVRRDSGLKPKDLVGMPWRLAFALQADGWYLRSDIIWHKPNPMPESVTDRPTKAHEYLFLLSKNSRYFYNAEAIKEPVTGNSHERGDGVNPKAKWKTPDGWDTSTGEGSHNSFHKNGRGKGKTPGKNSRIHVDRDPLHLQHRVKRSRQNESFSAAVKGLVDSRNKRTVWTVATAAFSDAHFATFPPDLIRPCIRAGSRPGDTILDPFGGSGTTGQVALEEGRKAILIELNPKYIELIRQRTNVTPGLAI